MSQSLTEKLESLKTEALRELSATLFNLESLEAFRVSYLGKNGKLTQILKDVGKLSPEERPKTGQLANQIKQVITLEIEKHAQTLQLEERNKALQEESVDVTLPGKTMWRGTRHPLKKTMEEIVQIFSNYGFQVAQGPEIESEYYNFDALNTPAWHPARDMQDTFYTVDQTVLRTHTSPVQIRVMERYKPPLRIVAPGAVYRHDDDVSHSPMFHQIEGLLVDENVSMAHLKGMITGFVHQYFSPQTHVRFRPSFFPFTEPSAELDIECMMCHGKGCNVCKHSGWLEVLGCGMVHPNVFRAVKYNAKKLSGFAFGMGIERLTMLKYGVDHIKLFFENDLRFLRQFS